MSTAVVQGYPANHPRYGTYSDSTVLPQILALPLSTYIGLPVDSLISDLPTNFSAQLFKPSDRIGYAKGVVQIYGLSGTNSCAVEIFIETFQYLTFPNYSNIDTWNFSLAKQETLAYIKVWKNNRCVYGCNNPNYY